MQKKLLRKILALGIIILFIGVGIHPAFAVDTNQSIVNKVSEEECWECKEVNDRQLVVLEKQIKRIKVYTKLLLVLSKDIPEVKEKCEEILDLINSEFPIICDILVSILTQLELIAHILDYLYSVFPPEVNPIIAAIILSLSIPPEYITPIVYALGISFDCEWLPPL